MSSSPRSADVIVIGAGVIGLSLALDLLRAGQRVTVFEQGRVGPGGASWAGGGILAPLDTDLAPALAPLLRDSLARYPEWCAELQQDSGIDPEYLLSGLQVQAPVDPTGWQRVAQLCGTPLHETANGLDLPGIAQVRSPRLLRALAASVRARGGLLREGEPVRGLLGETRVGGVRTDAGDYAAAVVVLAAGAWSAALWSGAPLRPVRGQMLLLDARPGEFGPIVLREGHYLIPRRDGPVLAGSTVEDVGFEQATSAAGRDAILGAVRRMAPALAQRAVLAHWSGLRPATPDGLPRMGWAEDRPGLYLSSGHYRLGITLAPGSARRAAAEILARG